MLQLIKQESGIELPICTMGEYLKRWGFTPQKPITKAYVSTDIHEYRITLESTPKHRASPRHAGHGCRMTVVRRSRVWAWMQSRIGSLQTSLG